MLHLSNLEYQENETIAMWSPNHPLIHPDKSHLHRSLVQGYHLTPKVIKKGPSTLETAMKVKIKTPNTFD